jgi:hypothetical protein
MVCFAEALTGSFAGSLAISPSRLAQNSCDSHRRLLDSDVTI